METNGGADSTVAIGRRTLTVALVGNPNTGKSTLFGALVGVRQRVGNYPGVTVERRSGHASIEGRDYELIDLPGVYSLTPRSEDEAVTVRALLGASPDGQPPDGVICVVDASNPRRNFYLVSQVLELGLPTVVVLNMLDLAESEGYTIDVPALEARLGVPVVGVRASTGAGLDLLRGRLHHVLEAAACGRTEDEFGRTGDSTSASDGRFAFRPVESPLPAEIEAAVAGLAASGGEDDAASATRENFVARRLLMDPTGRFRRLVLGAAIDPIPSECDCRTAQEALNGLRYEIPRVETRCRYAWIDRLFDGAVNHSPPNRVTWTDRLDRILTHRIGGLIMFGALMVVMFQVVFSWSAPVTGAIETLVTAGADWLRAGFWAYGLGGGVLEGLLCDGVVAGVGSVAGFLPQILMLFLFIGLLEDCGYMARAAFLMDRVMSRVGLCGKAFIPLLSCYACAVPGIMATRVIENSRNRLATILVAPFMTCSARLPIYVMLISAFIPARMAWTVGGLRLVSLQAGVLAAMYVVGIMAAIVTALLLKKSVLRGGIPCFVMELPSYKWPSPGIVLHRVAERGWQFVRSAGTIICLASVAVWAALYFPHDPQSARNDPHVQALRSELADMPDDSPHRATLLERLDGEMAAAYQRTSLLGRFGRAIEPVFRPLGWDWRIGCSVMASLPAREIVVAALGVSFSGGEADVGEGEAGFRSRLTSATWPDGRPVFNVPVALSLMVFFTLCSQCSATLATMRRETGSWRWPAASFTYMTLLAYLAAMATYQLGMWLGG